MVSYLALPCDMTRIYYLVDAGGFRSLPTTCGWHFANCVHLSLHSLVAQGSVGLGMLAVRTGVRDTIFHCPLSAVLARLPKMRKIRRCPRDSC
jgi:hypothetical protein